MFAERVFLWLSSAPYSEAGKSDVILQQETAACVNIIVRSLPESEK